MIEIGAAASDNSTIWGDLLVAAFGALVAAGLLWVVGKRRRESDLAAVATFYRLYGEFFAAWQLWDSHKRKGVPGKGEPHELQWELLEQVERAEGGYEALLVKLASERVLDDTIRALPEITDASERRCTLWTDAADRLGLDGKPAPGEAPNRA